MKRGTMALELTLALCVGVLSGCEDETTAPADTGELVVIALAESPAPAPAARASSAAAGPLSAPIGAPSSWLIGLYDFQISANSDCSGPFVTAFDNGGAPAVRDFATNPELFRADGLPIGTYPCVAMRITDVMEFQSAVSGGACAAGTTYRGDVYPAGHEPFLDLSLSAIPATGTDAAPGEDGIYLLFSTNRTATVARGFSENQVVPLSSPLVIPDEVTFYWDASNAVNDTGTSCNLEPDAPGLFW